MCWWVLCGCALSVLVGLCTCICVCVHVKVCMCPFPHCHKNLNFLVLIIMHLGHQSFLCFGALSTCYYCVFNFVFNKCVCAAQNCFPNYLLSLFFLFCFLFSALFLSLFFLSFFSFFLSFFKNWKSYMSETCRPLFSLVDPKMNSVMKQATGICTKKDSVLQS